MISSGFSRHIPSTDHILAKSNEFVQNRSYLICFGYSKAHEDLQVLMRYLFLVRCLTEYQNRLEFPLRQGGYDDVFISNLIIFYNKLHFVDIVEVRKNPYIEFLHWGLRHDHKIHDVRDTYLDLWEQYSRTCRIFFAKPLESPQWLYFALTVLYWCLTVGFSTAQDQGVKPCSCPSGCTHRSG